MDVLLNVGIVPFTAVSDTIQSMLISIEMTGPSSVTDSSSSLLTAILRERMRENPTHFDHSAERIISWLITKWTPSSCPSSGAMLLANASRSLV
jgi:ataxia telangiectasia mutated family protein